MRIRAAVMREINQPLSVEEIELDPPKAGEVLVRMVAAGVCGSDVHFITGHRRSRLEFVTRTYPLDDINVAVEDLRAGRNVRGVVVYGR